MSSSKQLLLAGVSSLALAISAPAVMAGESMFPETPGLARENQNPLTALFEGLAQKLNVVGPNLAESKPAVIAADPQNIDAPNLAVSAPAAMGAKPSPKRRAVSASAAMAAAPIDGPKSAVAAPAVMAAEPMFPETPGLTRRNQNQNRSTVWVEGGAQGLIADDPLFNVPPKSWGWNGAIGFDYRFNAIWHLSGDFRYGSNQKRTTSRSPLASFVIATISGSPATTAIKGASSANRKEHNWVADFMVGRDIGLGSDNPQIKAGVRVAEIRGRTEGSASWNVPTATACSTPCVIANVTHTRSYVQTNQFLGVGPRLALEGSHPLGGAWSLDYMVAAAGLLGTRKVDQTVTASGAVVCVAGCPANVSSSNDGIVFNPDAMLGLSYAITSNAKLSVNYRIDAYIAALRTIDGFSGAFQTVDRIYHGPNLRLTYDY